MKYVWFFIIVIVFAGCERDREEREIHIAVSLAGADQFTSMQHLKGLQDAAGGENITVSWRLAMMDADMQSRQLDTLLAGNPDIIAVSIADPRRPDDIIGKLKTAEIPVVGFNRLVPKFQYDLVVTPNYRSMGKDIAQQIINRDEPDIKNILLLHGLLTGVQDSLIVNSFLNTIEQYERYAVRVIEAEHPKGNLRGSIHIPGDTDVIVAVNPYLTGTVSDIIKDSDEDGSDHTSPIIIGVGEPEMYLGIESDKLFLVSRQPYDGAIRLVDAAADYVRGRFRHDSEDVMQIGDYIYPVVYTPHRTIHNNTE